VNAPYQRPTISASRLKTIGGEKGSPGCERKLAAHYLFNMKQAETDALVFGSALHTMAEHYQATGVVLEPEGDVARVFSAGAHLLATCGDLLVEHEHVGELPDGSPYVAYLDGHSADGTTSTHTVVIQDIKTTSNPKYALTGRVGDQDGPYALRRDIQVMFYAWILLCAPAHWFCPPLPADAPGPKHWQWWDPKERNANSARARWLYFLTKGVPRAWDESEFITPAMAQAFMSGTIMPLVAKINALHEWHHAHPHATLDEIDRNLSACRDFRGHYGRWCGAGERDACNHDQLGTPVLDLVQLKVRKMTTPQERMAALRNKINSAVTASAAPAAPQQAPDASPPPPPPAAEAPAVVAAPLLESTPTAPADAVAEPTRGQKAAATRAARRAAQPSAGVGINPPESSEPAAELTAPAPRAVTVPVAVVTLIGIEEITKFLVSQGYAVTKGAA
jgi:hypothetical protein